ALRLAAGRQGSYFRASLLLRRRARRAMPWGKPSSGSRRLLGIPGVLLLLATSALADHIPLNRDPGAYFLIAMRSMGVFNLAMEPPGCNLGVNCVEIINQFGSCGVFHSKHARIPEPGQVAANQVCGTRSFFQVFRNKETCGSPSCATIIHPGAKPDCTDS